MTRYICTMQNSLKEKSILSQKHLQQEKKLSPTIYRGEKFITLARNVYKFNDERAKIKLGLNKILGSNIKEVKSYK